MRAATVTRCTHLACFRKVLFPFLVSNHFLLFLSRSTLKCFLSLSLLSLPRLFHSLMAPVTLSLSLSLSSLPSLKLYNTRIHTSYSHLYHPQQTQTHFLDRPTLGDSLSFALTPTHSHTQSRLEHSLSVALSPTQTHTHSHIRRKLKQDLAPTPSFLDTKNVKGSGAADVVVAPS